MKQFILLFTITITAAQAMAQRNPDSTYMPAIHGIKLFQHGDQLSYPVMTLGASAALELHFDDLDAKVKSYSYTYQLCDADWNVIDLNPLDYIKGFTQNRLTQYRASSIALVKYIQYSVILPENNCVPYKSGNYLLKVFLNGDTSKLAFTRRLLVQDNKVNIGLKTAQPFNSQMMRTHQKVQFSIDKSKLNILNPQQQLKVVVLQNYNWNTAVFGAQPLFMRNNVFEYNGERDFVFPAGKEYRWADLQSFRYQSPRIDHVDKNTVPLDVYMRADGERSGERFLSIQDYNGFYSITGTDVNNAWVQGDYANVHFMYVPNAKHAYADKDVYISGEMTVNALNNDTKLSYNENTGAYEITLLLKQGYYNYMYVTKDNKTKNSKPETVTTEGDYWETENTYTVLVYYRSLGNRYDELVGVATINSKFGAR